MKVHRYDHARWGAANRELLNREVAFLRNPPPGPALPPLLFAGESLREGWLARGCLEGDLLLDLINSGRPYDAVTFVQDVLAELVMLEHSGLYHSDVRTWNVIIGADGHASLIDYGSDRRAAGRLRLAARRLPVVSDLRARGPWPGHDRVAADPPPLVQSGRIAGGAHAFWSMLESPPATWSFARLQQEIARAPSTTVTSGAFGTILAALEVLDARSEDQRRKPRGPFEAALPEDLRRTREAQIEAALSGNDASSTHVPACRAARGRACRGAETTLPRPSARSDRHNGARGRARPLPRSHHRSTSWRVSAPLRFVRRCFDALLRRLRPR